MRAYAWSFSTLPSASPAGALGAGVDAGGAADPPVDAVLSAVAPPLAGPVAGAACRCAALWPGADCGAPASLREVRKDAAAPTAPPTTIAARMPGITSRRSTRRLLR
jgi:hypothetical protein